MTRTHDLLITNQLLYQLSYTSVCYENRPLAGFFFSLPQFWGFEKSCLTYNPRTLLIMNHNKKYFSTSTLVESRAKVKIICENSS